MADMAAQLMLCLMVGGAAGKLADTQLTRPERLGWAIRIVVLFYITGRLIWLAGMDH